MARRHQFKSMTHGDGAVERLYEVRLMAPFVQHRVLMKLVPLIAARVAQGGLESGKKVSTQVVAQMISALADLTQENHDFCWDSLLGCISTQDATGGPWQAVWNPAAKAFQFGDIDLIDAYALLQEAVEFTYGNFFVLLQRLLPAAQAQAGLGTSQ